MTHLSHMRLCAYAFNILYMLVTSIVFLFSLLPETLLHCLSCVHLLALHRQLLADTLLMDRPTMQNAGKNPYCLIQIEDIHASQNEVFLKKSFCFRSDRQSYTFYLPCVVGRTRCAGCSPGQQGVHHGQTYQLPFKWSNFKITETVHSSLLLFQLILTGVFYCFKLSIFILKMYSP